MCWCWVLYIQFSDLLVNLVNNEYYYSFMDLFYYSSKDIISTDSFYYSTKDVIMIYFKITGQLLDGWMLSNCYIKELLPVPKLYFLIHQSSVMNILAFLTIAVLTLQVHCQGRKPEPAISFSEQQIFPGSEAGVWGNWGPWTRERECHHEEECDGLSTETTDTPCVPSDGKNISI